VDAKLELRRVSKGETLLYKKPEAISPIKTRETGLKCIKGRAGDTGRRVDRRGGYSIL